MFDYIGLHICAYVIDIKKGTDIFAITSVTSEFSSVVLDAVLVNYSIESLE